jgi:hypothetical protein
MIPTTKFAVSSVQVSQLPIGCDQIEGIYNGAAAAWLQVHDACIAPQTGDVPLYELPLSAATQFQETLQVARLELTEGLFVGVSSTEGTYTASASVMDITVWTDIKPLATNAVGDKTSNVSSLQVWSEATGTTSGKKLYQLIVSFNNFGPYMVAVYADDTPSNNDPAVQQAVMGSTLAGSSNRLQTGVFYKFQFGPGLRPLDQSLINQVIRQGCTVQLQNNLANTTANVDGTILAITN